MGALEGTTGRRRIYLMRHGHVDYFSAEVLRTRNTRDVPLTEQGREEAIAAGNALRAITFDRAICSGLARTKETAGLVLSRFDAPPALETEPALEEIHGGSPQVFSRDELVATMVFHFARAAEDGATMMEGGEAFAGAQARAIAALQRILAEPGWKRILIVAHEGINRLLLSWSTGAGLRAAHAFEQDTGCINVIDFDMVPEEAGRTGTLIERTIIKAVNLTPYNYIKNGMNRTSLEAIFYRDEGGPA